jgi:hypothetical protein
MVVLLALPTLVADKNVDPHELGKAVYVYLMLSFGVVLILGGSFPLLISTLSMSPLSPSGYAGLLVLIAVGVFLLFIISQRVCTKIDHRVAAIPRALYYCTFFVLGAVLCTFGVLHLLIGILSQIAAESTSEAMEWWVVPLVLLALSGGLLHLFRCASEGRFAAACKGKKGKK